MDSSVILRFTLAHSCYPITKFYSFKLEHYNLSYMELLIGILIFLVAIIAVPLIISLLVKSIAPTSKQKGPKPIATPTPVQTPTPQAPPPKSSPYAYRKKQYIMTKSEHNLLRVLEQIFDHRYAIYPQAHLDTFLDHQIAGQDWRAALSTIQRKSVDFLVCDATYGTPVVAIELDDASHNQPSRMERDEKVEAICRQARMPLVRIRWRSAYNVDEIRHNIEQYLGRELYI